MAYELWIDAEIPSETQFTVNTQHTKRRGNFLGAQKERRKWNENQNQITDTTCCDLDSPGNFHSDAL